MSSSYSAKDITVLQGLEPVRRRPGMYIGGTDVDGLHHLLWEVVDNAVDEAMNGHATTVTVVLEEDGLTATVSDNGRGIPVDVHPEHGRSALELVLTTLHAGGKFDQKSYRTAGGLHGVGSSVVNALSELLVAQVKRGEVTWEQRYRRGKPVSELRQVGPARGTGTMITFKPDPKIFGDQLRFDAPRIAAHLETRSYLHRGLRIVFKDRLHQATHEFKHEEGLSEYLEQLVAESGEQKVHPAPFLLERSADPRFELALCWTTAPREHIHSFVNGIRTRDGGAHEQGLKDAVAKATRSYMEAHDKLPRGLAVSAEEIREGLVALVSVFLAEPQFQGQTKNRLNNPELKAVVDGLVRAALESWFHTHPSVGEAVTARVVEAARARAAARAASSKVRGKGSPITRRVQLPGKLADCSAAETSRRELFLVEGESAGGSAKQGRHRETQAVLPLRGKVLNVEQASVKKVLANKELADLVQTLGCGIGDGFDLQRLRYGRIILLMDADSDGHHISTLLLTFFYNYLPRLIEEGHVYLGQPPLYRIDVGERTYWALDDAEKERILARQAQGQGKRKAEIVRFKGLGEMMPKVLYETTLCPTRRRLLRVTIPLEAQEETRKVIGQLMGKDPAPRFRLIQEGASEVQELDV
ncbi:MAG: type IIA DNA topoisomerase subunit B [Deltaproteobacteria bacterium]|nr:type IIA DNA topoisomerase subunit B [Deltaproteobacteria bacterium]